MIMAILPTVLRPIMASFYFAATNFPDNRKEEKNCLDRSRLYVKVRERDGDSKLQVCKFWETNLLHIPISKSCLELRKCPKFGYTLVLSEGVFYFQRHVNKVKKNPFIIDHIYYYCVTLSSIKMYFILLSIKIYCDELQLKRIVWLPLLEKLSRAEQKFRV